MAANIARLSLAIQDGSSSPRDRRAIDRAQPTGVSFCAPRHAGRGHFDLGDQLSGRGDRRLSLLWRARRTPRSSALIRRASSDKRRRRLGSCCCRWLVLSSRLGWIPTPEWTLPWLFVGGGNAGPRDGSDHCWSRRRPAGSIKRRDSSAQHLAAQHRLDAGRNVLRSAAARANAALYFFLLR